MTAKDYNRYHETETWKAWKWRANRTSGAQVAETTLLVRYYVVRKEDEQQRNKSLVHQFINHLLVCASNLFPYHFVNRTRIFFSLVDVISAEIRSTSHYLRSRIDNKQMAGHRKWIFFWKKCQRNKRERKKKVRLNATSTFCWIISNVFWLETPRLSPTVTFSAGIWPHWTYSIGSIASFFFGKRRRESHWRLPVTFQIRKRWEWPQHARNNKKAAAAGLC